MNWTRNGLPSWIVALWMTAGCQGLGACSPSRIAPLAPGANGTALIRLNQQISESEDLFPIPAKVSLRAPIEQLLSVVQRSGTLSTALTSTAIDPSKTDKKDLQIVRLQRAGGALFIPPELLVFTPFKAIGIASGDIVDILPLAATEIGIGLALPKIKCEIEGPFVENRTYVFNAAIGLGPDMRTTIEGLQSDLPKDQIEPGPGSGLETQLGKANILVVTRTNSIGIVEKYIIPTVNSDLAAAFPTGSDVESRWGVYQQFAMVSGDIIEYTRAEIFLQAINGDLRIPRQTTGPQAPLRGHKCLSHRKTSWSLTARQLYLP